MVLGVRNFLLGLINLILGIIALFLGLRIIFSLVGANSSAPFVAWVYLVSEGLITPFRGMFPNFAMGNNMYLDVVAVIALIVYSLVGYIIVALVDSAFKPAIYDEEERRRLNHYRQAHAHDIDR